MLKLALAAAVVAACASVAGATTMAYEGFNYPVGDLPGGTAVTGPGFTGTWFRSINESFNALVSSPSLAYTDTNSASMPTTANRLVNGHGVLLETFDTGVTGPFGLAGYRDASGNIGLDGTTLYMGVLLKEGTGNTGFSTFEIYRGGTGDANRRLSIGSWNGNGSGTNSTDYFVNTWTPTNSSPASADLIANDGNTHLFVLKFAFGAANNDTISVYVDPTLTTEPATPNATITGVSDLSFNLVGTGVFSATSSMTEDEIRVASTFAEAVPEPTAVGMCAVGALALLRRRRAV